MTKHCTYCDTTKESTEFYNKTASTDKLDDRCKECRKAYQVEQHHSKKGLVTVMYKGQRRVSIKRIHIPPTYSSKELRSYLYNLPKYHIMYNDWKESDFDISLRPSIDRKNDYLGYSLDNINLITWEDHVKSTGADTRAGRNNKRSYAVQQLYLKTGKVKATFHSMEEAQRRTAISSTGISRTARGLATQCGGFDWKIIAKNY